MKFLDDAMISGLLPAETSAFPSPVPNADRRRAMFKPGCRRPRASARSKRG